MPRRPDPAVLDHQEWLGFVQPTGLVVSPTALVSAGAVLDRRDIQGQRLIEACTVDDGGAGGEQSEPRIHDFREFATEVLGWRFSANAYAGTEEAPIPGELEVPLPDYGETLRPDFAVRELEPDDDGSRWQLLVKVVEADQALDAIVRGNGRLEASPHGRMERLLRQTGVPAGLLVNGSVLRLISAPRGESSGWLDFRLGEMLQTAGRPISAALRLLLSETRLLALPRAQRLPALLEDSRKYQNEVSERLAQQVLHALYALLRGFQAAHDQSGGELLREPLSEDPDEVYRGLLTVILRLVFLLYAEERDMLSEDETFLRNYSLAGLYERLRDDAAQYPDTMDRRFGAWAQLLALFRMLYDGAESGSMKLPRRHGVLFDPDRYPFLEGRRGAGGRQVGERIEPPLVPDGTIHRALEKLLVLDGERISYRALDVEQIGSVYETMMGFRLERAEGRSVAIRAQKKSGAPTAVNLEALLEVPPKRRDRWVRERADRKLSAKVRKAVRGAASVTDLHAALAPVVDRQASPDLMPKGAMVLQPSEERRRSGSHYTPRSLTEPIVRTTLEPILQRLRGESAGPPTPHELLDLKVCDPAMGSGAFLVETCRQLGDALIESWHYHDVKPAIPPDEDEVVYARRLVAQRCLYGVDRNPVAVDLAKVSLWLVTLAKDHAFTFLDHALRHGDSLVGLSRRQIESFHWDPKARGMQAGFEAMRIGDHMERVAELRREIREADESVADWELRDLWDRADTELAAVRLFGDLVVTAFFEGGKKTEREETRSRYASAVVGGEAQVARDQIAESRQADPPVVPFHWEFEFPEVFDRSRSGFDAMVGNPPFLGGKRISTTLGTSYRDWLALVHTGASSNADLVAHFFRRAFALTREEGCFGLIATNTIAQGDTRSSGLRWICTHGGKIYRARRRLRWPGQASVVVSVLHVVKGEHEGPALLDERKVETITAFLSSRGGHEDPAQLAANQGKSFVGFYVLGMGFTFDDTDRRGVATPLEDMRALLEEHPEYDEVIQPYLGGEEVNSTPTHAHHRFVINFGARSEAECRQRWPRLMEIVESKVKPARMKVRRKALRDKWWQFAEKQPALRQATAGLERVLVISQTSNTVAFTFLPTGVVWSHKLIVVPLDTYSAFAALQARTHDLWVRFFGSTMKDDTVYTPSDCFETFPFPEEWDVRADLEAAGQRYFEYRAKVLVSNEQGLTDTYNRFHDPDESHPQILGLRKLHEEMDRAVLDAYGWSDIPTECEFLLDYEIDEEEWNPRKKKPWRYRWPDEVHDEVLARLLELNAERAAEERRAGSKRSRGSAGAKRSSSGSETQSTGDLFG